MVSFFINFYRFFKIIVTGLKEDKEFQFLFLFIFLLLVGATVFYTKVEAWSILDALYFSIMTMATVGYGDFVPTTDISKLFTIIYAFLSIGSFVAFTAKSVQIMLENNQKRIAKIKSKKNTGKD